MASTVELIVKARDEASKPIQAISSSLKSLSDSSSRTGSEMMKLNNSADKLDTTMGAMASQIKTAVPATEKLGNESEKLSGSLRKNETAAKSTAAGMDKLGKETKQAEGSFHNFGGKINDLIEGFTGLNVAQFASIGGIIALVDAVKEAISSYSDYAESVDKFSQATGMSAESVSRLIQLADDFRVSQESLQNAMKLALQNGFQPTIENLATLSDRYKSISDPTKRATEMQKIFGKSWIELVPLLEKGGDAIRDAAKAIDDGLIVTDKGIVENRLYAASVDDLGDAWTGFKNKIAKDAIPVLTDVLTAFSNTGDEVKKNKGTWMDFIPAISNATGSFRALVNAIDERKKRTAELTKQLEDERAAQKEANDETLAAAETAKENATFTALMAQGYQELSQNAEAYAASQQRVNDQIKQGADAAKNLQDAQATLQSAQQAFGQSYSDKIISKLEAAGVKGDKLNQVYEVLDKRYGTQYVATDKANKQTDAMIKKYASANGTIDDFTAGLIDNQSAWEDLDGSLQKAQEGFQAATTAWNNFITRIAEADGLRFVITVDTVATGAGIKAPVALVGGGGSKNQAKFKASGGPVMAGEGYIVGENGPEWFRPWSGGYITNSVDTPGLSEIKPIQQTIIMQNTINYPIDFEYAAQKIAGIIRRKGGT